MNKTTESLIRAAFQIARQNNRVPVQKYVYEPDGSAIHLRKSRSCLTALGREAINNKEYDKIPPVLLKRVEVRRAHLIDFSRYDGATLRELRAERGCGRPIARIQTGA